MLVEKSRWVFSPDLFLYRAFVLIQRAVQNEDFRPMLGMGCACVKKKKKKSLALLKNRPLVGSNFSQTSLFKSIGLTAAEL